MAVYTKINKKDISHINKKFNDEKFINFKGIKQGIENNSNNYTRFLIFSKDNSVAGENDKTSIIFSVKHEPGALYQILKEFNDNDINLTKIESRPNKNTNWEYNFFVDFLGHFSNDKIQSVLKNISENVLFLKIIGSYPIADLD